jgi:hypothetical protein
MSKTELPWMKFEAIKTSMRQDGKGTYVTLLVHPDEVPIDLLSARSGMRLMIGALLLNDHDEPVKGRDADEGDKAVQSAGMLCRNIRFQKWMAAKGYAFGTSEQECADGLKAHCVIGSRADLKTDRGARETFIKLRAAFEDETF